MIYLLDTNAVSDLLVNHAKVLNQTEQHLINGDTVGICQPVYYELVRGLLWKNAPKKLQILQDEVIPKLGWVRLIEDDWLQAANFWATAVKSGKQLSDMDFLIAAITHRLNAVLVSSDNDFDALPNQARKLA